MREAVIVSTARTPIGKAYRGAFNNTTSPAMGGHAIKHAVERAKVDPAEVEDVIMGAAIQMGSAFQNVARQSLLHAGLPDSVAGQSIDRQCSSGMMAISMAAKQIISDGMDVAIGGGVESISMNQTADIFAIPDPDLLANKPALYMSMLETAEVVGERYNMSREAQDAYSAESQARTAAAQQAGAFDDEIVPLKSTMKLQDKETGKVNEIEMLLDKDEATVRALRLRVLQDSSRYLAAARSSKRANTLRQAMPRNCLMAHQLVYLWKQALQRNVVCSLWVPTAAWLLQEQILTRWALVLFSPCLSCLRKTA